MRDFPFLIAARRKRLRVSLTQASDTLTTLAGTEGPRVSRALVHAWEQGRIPGAKYLPALSVWLVVPQVELLGMRLRLVRRRAALRAVHADEDAPC